MHPAHAAVAPAGVGNLCPAEHFIDSGCSLRNTSMFAHYQEAVQLMVQQLRCPLSRLSKIAANRTHMGQNRASSLHLSAYPKAVHAAQVGMALALEWVVDLCWTQHSLVQPAYCMPSVSTASIIYTIHIIAYFVPLRQAPCLFGTSKPSQHPLKILNTYHYLASKPHVPPHMERSQPACGAVQVGPREQTKAKY